MMTPSEILDADDFVVGLSLQCAHLFFELALKCNKPRIGICSHCIYDAQDVWPRACKNLSGRKLTPSPTCLLYAMRCTRPLTVLTSGVPGLENNYYYNVVMAEEVRRVFQRQSPLPATCVTFKVNPDCAAFCKKNDIALPELPSRDLIGLRAACARVAHISGVAEP